ncbi:hypothetical protein B484DRAFT_404101, partial [Ochromonadaceae sp. CCMP2298]
MIARAPSLLVALLALFALFAAVDADTPIDLGDAYSYAVLAGREIRYASGRPTINGNIGLYPGTSITGIIVPIHNGVVDIDNPASIAALSALSAAYSAAEGKEATSDLSGQDLGGMTLVGGVYTFSDSAALDGVLTLDAQGNPAALWTFQIGPDRRGVMEFAMRSAVVFKDGVGNANHVTWWVGNAATVNYGATVVGNVLVGISIIAFGDVTLVADTVLTGDLAGMVLVPGVYRHPDSAELNGVLTLDAQSNAAAVWTLQIGKHMLFAPGSRVVFKDGVGSANHVTWWIGTAVTIGENAVNQLTVVLGTVLAGTSFTINHGARVTGRLLAQAASLYSALIGAQLTAEQQPISTAIGSALYSA